MTWVSEPPARRALVVNADDFGQTAEITEGILAAHARGIVTSTSLMVRGRAIPAAVDGSRRHPRLGVGLHLDLGEWAYRNGSWVALYEVVDLDDEAAIAAEVARQIEAFVTCLGRSPTHLDSHQHVHRRDTVRAIVTAAAHQLEIPLRHVTPDVAYCGAFYGQTEHGEPWPAAITVQSLSAVIAALPAGITELACHPGFGAGGDSMYDTERRVELDTLCDPSVRQVVDAAGIDLITFADVARGERHAAAQS